MPSNFEANTYVGVATKHGGGIFARLDNVNGQIIRLDAPHIIWGFTQLNVSIGIGVGGGISSAIVFAFNCPNPYVLNNKDVGKGEWSVDVSTGAKWDAIVKAFKGARYLPTLAKLVKYGVKGFDDLATLRSWSWDIYQATDAALSNKAKFVSIGIPGAGYGAECFVSVCLQGKLELENNPTVVGKYSEEQGSRGYDGAEGRGNY